MALNANQLEEIVTLVTNSHELATAREEAKKAFFGDDDTRPVQYWAGASDYKSKQRRFLDWFMFEFVLRDGRHPAEVGASMLVGADLQQAALAAVRQARYLLLQVKAIVGPSVFAAMEEEQFEIRSRFLANGLQRDNPILAHLVPIGRGVWLPGPGWMQWPIKFGPNVLGSLRELQTDPIEMERVLQGRTRQSEQGSLDHPRDEDLATAVSRMTAAAKAEGRDRLVVTARRWQALVKKHFDNPDMTAFVQEVTDRVGEVEEVSELNRWLGLAMNIWNTTPQPDRGGKTAQELAREGGRA